MRTGLRLAALLFLALPAAAQPAVQSFRLPNGLQVQLLEDHDHSLLRLQMASTWAAPGEGAGPSLSVLAPLALGVLDHCSAGIRSREAFHRTVEDLGMRVACESTPDGPVWTLLGPSTQAGSAFALLADTTARLLPEGSDLDDQRLRLFHEIQERGPEGNARRAFLQALERPGLAHAEITENELSKVYLSDVQDLLGRTFRPGRSVLAIHGDLTLAEARQLALANFGAWPEAEPHAPGRPATAKVAPAAKPPSMEWTAPSESPETELGLPFLPADPVQRASRSLLCLWLPRRFPQGQASLHQGAGGWAALVLRSGGSDSSLREAVADVRESGLRPRDLEEAKRLWTARRRSQEQHPVERMRTAVREALGIRAPTEAQIQGLDLDAVNATLKAWLDPAGMRVLRLGNGPEAPGQTSTPKREAKSR